MKTAKDVWVIMDKGHRVIACGQNRNRYVTFIENALDGAGGGVRTYATENKARAGYKVSQFFLGNYGSTERAEVQKYMEDTYGEETDTWDGKHTYIHVDQRNKYDDIYEPVLVSMSIEVSD